MTRHSVNMTTELEVAPDIDLESTDGPGSVVALALVVLAFVVVALVLALVLKSMPQLPFHNHQFLVLILYFLRAHGKAGN